jgi:hypothetical protein
MLSLGIQHFGFLEWSMSCDNEKAKAPDPGALHDASRCSTVEQSGGDSWIEQLEEKEWDQFGTRVTRPSGR